MAKVISPGYFPYCGDDGRGVNSFNGGTNRKEFNPLQPSVIITLDEATRLFWRQKSLNINVNISNSFYDSNTDTFYTDSFSGQYGPDVYAYDAPQYIVNVPDVSVWYTRKIPDESWLGAYTNFRIACPASGSASYYYVYPDYADGGSYYNTFVLFLFGNPFAKGEYAGGGFRILAGDRVEINYGVWGITDFHFYIGDLASLGSLDNPTSGPTIGNINFLGGYQLPVYGASPRFANASFSCSVNWNDDQWKFE